MRGKCTEENEKREKLVDFLFDEEFFMWYVLNSMLRTQNGGKTWK